MSENGKEEKELPGPNGSRGPLYRVFARWVVVAPGEGRPNAVGPLKVGTLSTTGTPPVPFHMDTSVVTVTTSGPLSPQLSSSTQGPPGSGPPSTRESMGFRTSRTESGENFLPP